MPGPYDLRMKEWIPAISAFLGFLAGATHGDRSRASPKARSQQALLLSTYDRFYPGACAQLLVELPQESIHGAL